MERSCRGSRHRLGEGAPVFAYLLLVQVVDVGLALVDEVDCEVVELVEVVGGEVEVVAPVPAEPADVLQDAVDELLFLFGGVGVVEAHVAAAAVLLGQPEVEAHGLGVADVEVAVGLGGEACHDAPAEPPGHVVGLHGGAHEVQGGFCLGFSHGVVPVISAGGGARIVVSGHMLAHRGGGGGIQSSRGGSS